MTHKMKLTGEQLKDAYHRSRRNMYEALSKKDLVNELLEVEQGSYKNMSYEEIVEQIRGYPPQMTNEEMMAGISPETIKDYLVETFHNCFDGWNDFEEEIINKLIKDIWIFHKSK